MSAILARTNRCRCVSFNCGMHSCRLIPVMRAVSVRVPTISHASQPHSVQAARGGRFAASHNRMRATRAKLWP